ncbi:MAG: serine/threonine transporter SstT [Eubacteriales bacterium]|nr:serine/threonine transporter SstT [Eubacteriales bacterium]
MKNLMKKWTDISLILRIIVGLVIGAVLGVAAPHASIIAVFGSVFVGALKGAAPILVFFLVASSLANANAGIGSRFRTVIMLYLAGTFLSSVVAVTASFAMPVTLQLALDAADSVAPSGIGEVLMNLINNMVVNPITAISSANYIGILFWAILLGFALKGLNAKSSCEVLSEFADGISTVVRWIIQFAPFGVMGLVFSSVSENGLAIFTTYGKLIVVLLLSMAAVQLIFYPIIVALVLKQNPYPLVLRCMRESGITAFFTRSSAANIPVNMQLCEDLGLDRDFYSVSIPLGATINMGGAAVTITVMTMACAHTLGINVSFGTAIVLSVLSALGACGASGVAGGSLLLIPMACSLFGINNDIAMQVVAVGFIIGVIQDSVETAINSNTDVLFTATAEYYEEHKNK